MECALSGSFYAYRSFLLVCVYCIYLTLDLCVYKHLSNSRDTALELACYVLVIIQVVNIHFNLMLLLI